MPSAKVRTLVLDLGDRAALARSLRGVTNGTTNTWPIVLYSAVRFGITPSVNALATLMLLINVGFIVITALILRRSRPRLGPGQEEAKGLSGALGLG